MGDLEHVIEAVSVVRRACLQLVCLPALASPREDGSVQIMGIHSTQNYTHDVSENTLLKELLMTQINMF